MGKGKAVFLRLMCALLLVISTIAPSVATASSTAGEYSIVVHPGSETRTIVDAQAIMFLPSYGSVRFNNTSLENGGILLTSQVYSNDSSSVQKVLLSVTYSENGQQYQMLEEIIISEGANEFVIPAEESLLTSSVLPDIDSSLFEIDAWYADEQKSHSTSIYIQRDTKIVSSGDLSLPLSIQGELEGDKYFLKGQLIVGQDIMLSNALENSSELVIDGELEYMYLQERDTQTYFNLYDFKGGSIFISNGTYTSSIKSNGIYWDAELTLSGNDILTVPSVPDTIVFNSLTHHTAQDLIVLNYDIELSSGEFKATSLDPSSSVAFTLRNDDQVVAEWQGSSITGSESVRDVKSGIYTLEAVVQVKGATLTTSKELQINSPLNTLKGTVVTAEDPVGAPLESGKVMLYELQSNSDHKQLVPMKSEEIELVNGKFEAFIPDAYVLDGKEYLLTVLNNEEKVLYAKRFTGQSTKLIHLTSEELKPFGIEAGDVDTVHTTISFDVSSSSFTQPVMLTGDGWNISSDSEVNVTWQGVDINEIGYIWSSLIAKDIGTINLANEEWKTLKPLANYPDASISKEGYSELRLGGLEKDISRNVLLTVNDGDFIYSGHVNTWNAPSGEVRFETYTGTGSFDATRNSFHIQYMDQNYQDININEYQMDKKLELTYAIFNKANEQVGESIVTNQLNNLSLSSKLPKGTYSLKLISANVDKQIVSLSATIPFTVGDVEEPTTEQTNIKALYLNTDTPYGKFDKYSGSIMVKKKPVNGEYTSYIYFYPNSQAGNYYPNQYFNVEPTAEYDVQIQISQYGDSTLIIDKKTMTGKELMESSVADPLSVSEGLLKLKVSSTLAKEDLEEFGMNLQDTNPGSTSIHHFFREQTDLTIYLPSGNYVGAFMTTDQKRNVKVMPLEEFTMNQNKEIVLNETDFAKYTFVDGAKKLSIFGYETSSGRSIYYNPDKVFDSVSYPKSLSGDLNLYVADKEQNSTLWGYMVRVPAGNNGLEKEFAFSNKINGILHDVKVQPSANGYSLRPVYSLKAGELNVHTIFRALEGNSIQGVSETDPIRDYIGLFDNWNRISADLLLKDATGKVVWTSSEDMRYGNSHYVPYTVAEGTYTLEMLIPVASGKSITLTKEVQLSGEGSPFIELYSPEHGMVIHDERIVVSGRANKDASVTLELFKGDQVVDTAKVLADEKGTFSHAFTQLSDGEFRVVAHNASQFTETWFTVDRAAPGKVTDIEFAKKDSGLEVSWAPAEKAVSYTVEVAVDNGQFAILAAKLKETTAVIPNIKPGSIYNVKVTAHSASDNSSVSEVASYEVPEFIVTQLELQDKRNDSGLLTIGDKLMITLVGSHGEGYTASSTVLVDGVGKDIALSYNALTDSYEGEMIIAEGMQQIEGISGFIAKGTEKTEVVKQEITWPVGSTVIGQVSDGNPVEGAIVRFVSDKSFAATTKADGTFEVGGLPEGTYKVAVTVGGKTYNKETLVIGKAVITAPLQLEVPALANVTLTLKDKGTASLVKDGLSLRLTGPNGFAAYGTSVNGQFKTYDGKTVFEHLQVGEYKVTVYGQGAYLTTHAAIVIQKNKTDYIVEVEKLDVVEKDITITLPEGVNEVSSMSLQSYSTYKQHQYSGIGSYYSYNVKKDGNGNIVIKNVAIADDYELQIEAEGYMPYVQKVDLKKTQNISGTLEKGRVVTGTVTDSQGNPVPNIDVYAYSENSYRTAKTDENGNYELIGLPKATPIQLNVYSQIYLEFKGEVAKGKDDAKLDIKLAKSASITGKVVDRNGKELQGVSVSASAVDSYGWARTAADGTFIITGLVDTKDYQLSFQVYGYPSLTVEGKKAGDVGTIYLQAEGDGDFEGTGNFLASAKSTVVPLEEVQFTLSYQNNGNVDATDVPVEIQLPNGLTLIPNSTALNGKEVNVTENKVTIPTVKAEESGKITFTGKVAEDIQDPSLTVTAKITEKGSILTTTASVVFVTLEAPAQTGTSKLKVYGNAKYGSTVEVYTENKLVGQTKVDGKWWFMDIQLPVKNTVDAQEFKLSAKVTDNGISTMSKPSTVKFLPDVPAIKDVTVYAGWNGDVKLNPYTGVATFAISENTPLNTTIVFDKEVDSAKITFLGKSYELVKGKNNTFTFDGYKLGRWTSFGEQLLEVTFKKGDMEVTLPLMNIIVLIDPSGYVFEGSMDNRLKGVQAIVETKVGENWVKWDAEKFGQVNPQVTDEEGRYGWDVITGEWRVIFTKDGYEPYISRVMNVPPPETELDIPMVRISDPAIMTTGITETDLTVQFDRLMKVNDHALQLFEVGSDTPIEGKVKVTSLPGYQSIPTPADKSAGFIAKDSNGEDGFFTIAPDAKVADTFTFVPAVALKANTAYELRVSGTVEDYAGKLLGDNKVFEFTTLHDGMPGEDEAATPAEVEKLINQLDDSSIDFEKDLAHVNAIFAKLDEEEKKLVTNSAKLQMMNDLSELRSSLQVKYPEYKSWSPHLKDTNVNKPWTITFNGQVDKEYLNSITIHDKDGKLVDGIKAEIKDKQIVLTPINPYQKNQLYYIYISKDIKNTKGVTLKQGVLATFVIE